jgi:hypothetical protein
MFRYGSASVAESNVKETYWFEKKCVCGNLCFKTASTKPCKTPGCPVKIARSVFARYSPNKYLLSHCTIIAAVDVDEAHDKTAKYKDYLIKPEYSKFINNNGDAWTKKMLASCYKTFVGANNYLEHVQVPELAKGKVVDAVLREVPVGKDKQGKDMTTYYVDILVATDRKHEDLVTKISSGRLKTLSMGCTIQFSICSKCGNVAKDETEACPHVRWEKNSPFYDSDGVQRKVAELCGHATLDDSVRFVDASWVANPAFTGAVIRNVVEPPKDIQAKINTASQKESYLFKDGDFLKAASALIAQDPKEPEEPATTKDELAPPDDAPAEDTPPADAPADAPVTEETAPTAPEGDVSQWKKQIKQKIMDELGEEITKEFSGESDDIRPTELETLDESLIQPTAGKILKKMGKAKRNWDLFLKKTAGNLNPNHFNRLRHGTYILLTSSDLTELSKYGYNRREFLAVMSYLDECTSSPMVLPLKRAIASMPGTSGKNPLEILTALVNKIGRKLTKKEAMKAISWLKLMDSYKE